MSKKFTLKNKSIYSVQILSTFPTIPNTVLRRDKVMALSEAELSAYQKSINNYGDEILELSEELEHSSEYGNTDSDDDGNTDSDDDGNTDSDDDQDKKESESTEEDEQLRGEAYKVKLLIDRRRNRLTHLKEEYKKQTDKFKKKILADEIKKLINEIKGLK